MSIDATHDPAIVPAAQAVVHPVWVRLTHWINAAAIIVMVGSGWEIYNASPLFAFVFPPPVTLGRWLAGGLLLHAHHTGGSSLMWPTGEISPARGPE